MSTLPEKFSAARKAQVETQLDYMRTFTSKVVESTEKVIALNLSTGRATLEKSAATLHQLISAKDPRDLITLTTQSQIGFDTLLAYGSSLFSIASSVQSDLLKAAAPATALSAPQLAAVTQLSVVPPTPVAEVEVEAQVDVAPAAAAPAEAVAPTPDLVDEVVPAPEAVKAKPIVEAVSEAVTQPEIPVLSAAPVVSEGAPELKFSGIEPVEAHKPAVQTQDKQLDMLTPKSRKKK